MRRTKAPRIKARSSDWNHRFIPAKRPGNHRRIVVSNKRFSVTLQTFSLQPRTQFLYRTPLGFFSHWTAETNNCNVAATLLIEFHVIRCRLWNTACLSGSRHEKTHAIWRADLEQYRRGHGDLFISFVLAADEPEQAFETLIASPVNARTRNWNRGITAKLETTISAYQIVRRFLCIEPRQFIESPTKCANSRPKNEQNFFHVTQYDFTQLTGCPVFASLRAKSCVAILRIGAFLTRMSLSLQHWNDLSLNWLSGDVVFVRNVNANSCQNAHDRISPTRKQGITPGRDAIRDSRIATAANKVVWAPLSHGKLLHLRREFDLPCRRTG